VGNKTLLTDFYDKLEKLTTELDLNDKLAYLWNYGETDLTCVIKS
jgi:hypothetical protein